ncbi:hypothetical protein [Corynebacterium renale]|uniref:Uncharacterized protein n=1 Tax=Corynebacterium renale TaxID=1724 RepID=A0A2A9DPN4_9CORY|nr:hypothetical protein [Corynebacterium renale]PFG28316.1 hypothetical protein ATK06_1423 [Corynebacterium renale]SQI19031.1 Uncharacterised protein [Corynebacterium renale]
MLFHEAIDQLSVELGAFDHNLLSPRYEERLLVAYIDAMKCGRKVTNLEAKREFLGIFEEPIYYEENFYSEIGVRDAFALAEEFAEMEPVVPLEFPTIEDMDLYRSH